MGTSPDALEAIAEWRITPQDEQSIDRPRKFLECLLELKSSATSS